jgi:hypothetical protein
MGVGKELQLVAAAPRPETFDSIRHHIDPAWIERALEATGTASLRRRRLPAEQVLWLVLGMALFRDRSIVELVEDLDLALPDPAKTGVARSAVSQARGRLGEDPLKWLFETTASHWSGVSTQRHRWRGLGLYGADGTSLLVPDSPENRTHFGAPKPDGRSEGAYPQLRLVALFALRSHLVVRAAFGPCQPGEYTYAAHVWSALPDHSLTILDRLFLSAGTLLAIHRAGPDRHWLIPAKSNTKWRVLQHLGPDDLLVEMDVSKVARKKDLSLPKTWGARAVRLQRPGFRDRWLLTSLLDPETYPAVEIAALYHERWEIELAYDEIKCEMLDREEAIRSTSPERVHQEVWGLLLAYNLIRLEMERIANEADIEPVRISFVTTLHLIRDEFILDAAAAPGAIPRHLQRLRANIKRFILPPRRTERSYPRAVKLRTSRYPKRPRLQRRGNAK